MHRVTISSHAQGHRYWAIGEYFATITAFVVSGRNFAGRPPSQDDLPMTKRGTGRRRPSPDTRMSDSLHSPHRGSAPMAIIRITHSPAIDQDWRPQYEHRVG